MKDFLTKQLFSSEYGIYFFRALALVLLISCFGLIGWYLFQGSDKWIYFIAPAGFTISALLVSFTAIQQIQNSIVEKEKDRLDSLINNIDYAIFLLLRLKRRINFHGDCLKRSDDLNVNLLMENINEIKLIWKELNSSGSVSTLAKYYSDLAGVDGTVLSISSSMSFYEDVKRENSSKIKALEKTPDAINSSISDIENICKKLKNERERVWNQALKKTNW